MHRGRLVGAVAAAAMKRSPMQAISGEVEKLVERRRVEMHRGKREREVEEDRRCPKAAHLLGARTGKNQSRKGSSRLCFDFVATKDYHCIVSFL